ncbi:hypothetical protein [Arsenicicoccus dermatophilus]|uniref:hypothetical protein n=1 Tax=Arsenicicoccus dermatophilus TaxID=1076331 RepID=UPI0039170C90
MRLYAATPARRVGQVLGDLGLLLWIALWVWAGRLVTDTVAALAEPVVGISTRARDLSRSMHDASASVGDVPMVGDKLRVPFDKASGTGDGIAQSSTALVDQIHQVATVLGIVVTAIPVVLAAVWWLSRRFSFIRQATVAQRFLDADADLDLFALRAMAAQPLPVLARVSDDPVGAWRRRDLDVIRRLATLELREHGLRPPRAAGTPGATPTTSPDPAPAPIPRRSVTGRTPE